MYMDKNPPCYGNMDAYKTGNCADCTEVRKCWDESFGEYL